MGDPKYPRRMWKKPKRPLNYELKMDELETLGTFGLKTKRELWKAHTELSRVRHQARSLLALRQEVRLEKEPILMKSLARIGLVSRDATLDDVLNLSVNDLLSRRLQTIVLKKFEFKTPYQARQAVVHGHIMIGDRKVNIPSYVVTLEEEDSVHFTSESKIPEILEKSSKAAKGQTEAQAGDAKGQTEAPAEAQAGDAKGQTEAQAGDAKGQTEAPAEAQAGDAKGQTEAPAEAQAGDAKGQTKTTDSESQNTAK